jgi:hypothetical protein
VVQTFVTRDPQRYHERAHRADAHKRYTDCWHCQRHMAICRSKIAFEDPEIAIATARSINQHTAYQRALVAYRCSWCEHSHLTSTVGDHDARAKRVERERRKWLIAQHTAREAIG